MHPCSRFKTVLIIIICLTFLTIPACEDYQVINVENRNSFTIKVIIASVPLDYAYAPHLNWNDRGVVIEPGKSMRGMMIALSKDRAGGIMSKYGVKAVNDRNEEVFSKVFTWDELHDLDWKIVILPLQKEGTK